MLTVHAVLCHCDKHRLSSEKVRKDARSILLKAAGGGHRVTIPFAFNEKENKLRDVGGQNRQQLRGEGGWEPEEGASNGRGKKGPDGRVRIDGTRVPGRGGVTGEVTVPLAELGVQEEEWVCGALVMWRSQKNTQIYRNAGPK